MALAYVLVVAETGKEHDIYRKMLKLPEVRELIPLFGEYDLIAKVETPDLDSLGEAILANIRTISGVSATRTLTAAKL